MKAVVSKCQFARWIPGVPREELAGFYAHASFLLNASYVEVSPLVDIEALMFGCPVTTTRFALHHCLLPAGTPVCNGYDDVDVSSHLAWRPGRRAPVNVIDAAKVQGDLLEIYRRLVR
jgi:glycosyltransferase involved in cell wall biosynthesis